MGFWDPIWSINALGWDIPIFGLLVYLGIQAFLIFLYLIISVIIKNRSKKLRKFSPDLLNGIRFMIRIVIVVLSATVFIVFLKVPSTTIWLIVGVLTAAIVFASVKTINNSGSLEELLESALCLTGLKNEREAAR